MFGFCDMLRNYYMHNFIMNLDLLDYYLHILGFNLALHRSLVFNVNDIQRDKIRISEQQIGGNFGREKGEMCGLTLLFICCFS